MILRSPKPRTLRWPLVILTLSALTLTGCGTKKPVAVVPPVLSHPLMTTVTPTTWTLAVSLVNTTSQSLYVQRHDWTLSWPSALGVGPDNPDTLSVSQPQAVWQGKTQGLTFSLPLTLAPHASCTLFLTWPWLQSPPVGPATVSATIGTQQWSLALSPGFLRPVVTDHAATVLQALQTAASAFAAIPANHSHPFPVWNPTLSPTPGPDPLAGKTADQWDMDALTVYPYLAVPTVPRTGTDLGIPAWNDHTVYWGITASDQVFFTAVPPTIPPTDAGLGRNGPGTGNGVWTSGSTPVFTLNHLRQGTTLAQIW